MAEGLLISTPTSISYSGSGSETATITSDGVVEFSNVSNLRLNGIFTSSYKNYMMTINCSGNLSNSIVYGSLMYSGTPVTSNLYVREEAFIANSTINSQNATNGFFHIGFAPTGTQDGFSIIYWGDMMVSGRRPKYLCRLTGSSNSIREYVGMFNYTTNLVDGISITPNNNPISGKVCIYAFNQ